jgi:hypothetical protein
VVPSSPGGGAGRGGDPVQYLTRQQELAELEHDPKLMTMFQSLEKLEPPISLFRLG